MTMTTSKQLNLKDIMPDRPKTRAECPKRDAETGRRDCRFVSCRHHLYLDITKRGRLRVNFPGVELEDMPETCSLDVGDGMPRTLEVIGVLMGGISRERVRQIEQAALLSFRAKATPGLQEHHDLVVPKKKTRAQRVSLTLDMTDYDALTPWGELPRGFRVRRLRQRLGWSASAVVGAMKTNRSALQKLETGDFDSVREDMLPRCMRVLGVPMSALGAGKMYQLSRGRRSEHHPSRLHGDLRLDWLIGLGPSLIWRRRLERERLTRRINQAEMAALIGWSTRQLARLELGKDTPTRLNRDRLMSLIKGRTS